MVQTIGLEEKVLMIKDSTEFRTRQPRVCRDSNYVNITFEDLEMDFKTMSSNRKSLNADALLSEIDSKNGHVFANLGVSAALQVNYNGKDYQVVVGQIRQGQGFSDNVAKLISGYIPSQFLNDPHGAMLVEIAEEFLPITFGSRFLCGKLENGQELPKPYTAVAEYEHADPFVLRAGNYALSADRRKVHINGKEMPGNPRVFYHSAVNGVQIVFPFKLDIDLNSLEGISHAEAEEKQRKTAHLRHAEDSPPEKGFLKTYLNKQPLYLLKTEKGRLTGEVSCFECGALAEVDEGKPITLSEAFAPAQEGIITVPNISFARYLANGSR